MVVMVGAVFLPVFATGLPMLTAGVFICGIPWGVFQTLTTAYAAEICPLPLRAHLTSFVNICWVSTGEKSTYIEILIFVYIGDGSVHQLRRRSCHSANQLCVGMEASVSGNGRGYTVQH